jgi:stage II sporulation protein M
LDISGYIYFSAILFTVSVITGYLYAYFAPEKSGEVFSTFQQVMAQRFGGMQSEFIVLAIFLNNLTATFMMLVFGLFFGILPGVGLVFNGLILGVVAYMVKKKSVFLLFSIIPHGIFEIPVFLVSAAIGLRLGHQVARKLVGGSEEAIQRELKKGVYFYLRWGVPFLFVAAFIETYISLRIAHFFM